MKPYKDTVYYAGTHYIILFAQTGKNRMPAKKFFDSIGPPDWGKLDRVLTRLADRGKIINIEQFRSIGDDLYEVKGGRFRLIGFFKAGHFVLTGGFEKRGGGKAANRVPDNERRKALRIKSEFEQTIPEFINTKKGRSGWKTTETSC